MRRKQSVICPLNSFTNKQFTYFFSFVLSSLTALRGKCVCVGGRVMGVQINNDHLLMTKATSLRHQTFWKGGAQERVHRCFSQWFVCTETDEKSLADTSSEMKLSFRVSTVDHTWRRKGFFKSLFFSCFLFQSDVQRRMEPFSVLFAERAQNVTNTPLPAKTRTLDILSCRR